MDTQWGTSLNKKNISPLTVHTEHPIGKNCIINPYYIIKKEMPFFKLKYKGKEVSKNLNLCPYFLTLQDNKKALKTATNGCFSGLFMFALPLILIYLTLKIVAGRGVTA